MSDDALEILAMECQRLGDRVTALEKQNATFATWIRILELAVARNAQAAYALDPIARERVPRRIIDSAGRLIVLRDNAA